MDKVDIQRKIEYYRDNPSKYIEYIENTFGFKLFWYQKQFLKLMLKKPLYFKGLGRRRWE